MKLFGRKPISAQIEEQLYHAEHMLLIAEAELENAQGRRDTLLKRRDRLNAALHNEVDKGKCPHGYSDWDQCPDCCH